MTLNSIKSLIDSGRIIIERNDGGYVPCLAIRKDITFQSEITLIEKHLLTVDEGNEIQYFLRDNNLQKIEFTEEKFALESILAQKKDLYKKVAFGHFQETGVALTLNNKQEITIFRKVKDE